MTQKEYLIQRFREAEVALDAIIDARILPLDIGAVLCTGIIATRMAIENSVEGDEFVADMAEAFRDANDMEIKLRELKGADCKPRP